MKILHEYLEHITNNMIIKDEEHYQKMLEQEPPWERLKEKEFVYVGELLDRCIELALKVQIDHKPLKMFMKNLNMYMTL